MTAVVAPRTETVAPADRARLFQLASWLLTYPDDALLQAQAELSIMAAGLEHRGVQQHVLAFLDWFAEAARPQVQQHYVETFDLRRKSGLYLTYYLHGDTRKRGIALLTLKQRYRAHGLRLADGELPDLLPIVLEFAAEVGPGDGEAPLRQHRHGVELLRGALESSGSPYRHLLEAVTLALPALTDGDRAAIAALALDGPPLESVGLGPYDGSSFGADGVGPSGVGTAGSFGPVGSCEHSEVRP